MSAELLRRAAALMRERAEAESHAASGWPEWSRREIDREGTCDGCAEGKRLVAAYDDPSGENEPWLCTDCAAESDHIQSWSPAVALAVALLLDNEANAMRSHDDGLYATPYNNARRSLLADVARAYLGESA